jgi:hypothetical protein
MRQKAQGDIVATGRYHPPGSDTFGTVLAWALGIWTLLAALAVGLAASVRNDERLGGWWLPAVASIGVFWSLGVIAILLLAAIVGVSVRAWRCRKRSRSGQPRGQV